MENKEKQEQERLKVVLTEDEIRITADMLAERIKRKEAKEDEKKDVIARYKNELDILESEIHLLASTVREKAEYRMVDIQTNCDYQRGTITVMRLDTGEIIRTRVMTAVERQMEFADK